MITKEIDLKAYWDDAKEVDEISPNMETLDIADDVQLSCWLSK